MTGQDRAGEGANAEDANAEDANVEDGAGALHPTHGSEAARGNEQPDVKDKPAAEHATRTIAGAKGPIEVVEDSGAAAGDVKTGR